mgnify:CR=1 FL=1
MRHNLAFWGKQQTKESAASAAEMHAAREKTESTWLKIFFITATVALGMALFVTALPLWMTFTLLAIAGPVWNIVDGAGLLNKKAGLYTEEKAHATFDYVLLGGVSLAALIYATITFAHAGSVFSSTALQILVGPVGFSIFAFAMFWVARETFKEGRANLKSAETHEERIDAYEKLSFDLSAWLFAGLGAILLTVGTTLVFFMPPVAAVLIIVGFAFYACSSLIKIAQLSGVSKRIVAFFATPESTTIAPPSNGLDDYEYRQSPTIGDQLGLDGPSPTQGDSNDIPAPDTSPLKIHVDAHAAPQVLASHNDVCPDEGQGYCEADIQGNPFLRHGPD